MWVGYVELCKIYSELRMWGNEKGKRVLKRRIMNRGRSFRRHMVVGGVPPQTDLIETSRYCRSHKVQKFTIMPPNLISHTLRIPKKVNIFNFHK